MSSGRGEHLGLLVAGYVMLVVFPLGALITGFAVVERRLGHGLFLVSAGMAMVLLYGWLAVSIAAN